MGLETLTQYLPIEYLPLIVLCLIAFFVYFCIIKPNLY